MTPRHPEWIWLDELESVSMTDLSSASGMSADELDELVEYGALVPLAAGKPERLFSAQYVTPLRAAGKMRLDYDLDIFTVVLLMDSLSRIEMLERQVRRLETTVQRAA